MVTADYNSLEMMIFLLERGADMEAKNHVSQSVSQWVRVWVREILCDWGREWVSEWVCGWVSERERVVLRETVCEWGSEWDRERVSQKVSQSVSNGENEWVSEWLLFLLITTAAASAVCLNDWVGLCYCCYFCTLWDVCAFRGESLALQT